jgi:chromosome segregation ATPase
MNEIIIDNFIKIVSKYFEDNPNAEVFEIKKGALADLVGVGLNLSQALSQTLAFQTTSVQDLKGKIAIERNEFLEFVKKKAEVKEAKLEFIKNQSLAQEESFGLNEQLSHLENRKERFTNDIENKRKQIAELEAYTEELEKEYPDLNARLEKLERVKFINFETDEENEN